MLPKASGIVPIVGGSLKQGVFEMRLVDFVNNLQKLVDQGHGDLQVYYRHGASSDCGELSCPTVTDEVDDYCGPFDLEAGEQYVSIYAGN